MSRILITDHFAFTGDDLAVEKYYEVEEVSAGTGAQNRTYWALLTEYFKSGLYSYSAQSVEELHKYIKRYYGAGFECVYALTPDGITRCKTLEEAQALPKTGLTRELYGHLKSFSAYTKAERRKIIDGLIAEMNTAGVNSRKYQEILAGMEQNYKERI